MNEPCAQNLLLRVRAGLKFGVAHNLWEKKGLRHLGSWVCLQKTIASQWSLHGKVDSIHFWRDFDALSYAASMRK